MSFARDTLLIFRRQMRLSLRNPAWVIIGLIQPVLYLAFFGPLLSKVFSQGVPGLPSSANAYGFFVPGLLIQLGLFGASFVGFSIISDWRFGVIERLRVTPVSRPGGSSSGRTPDGDAQLMPWRRRICATSPNSSSSSPLPTLALTALPLAGVSDVPGLAAGSPAGPGLAAGALPARRRRRNPETTNSRADAPATMTPDHTLGDKISPVAKLPTAAPIFHSISIALVR